MAAGPSNFAGSFNINAVSSPVAQDVEMGSMENPVEVENLYQTQPSILDELKASLANETRNAAFAIGGSVPIFLSEPGEDASKKKWRVRPIMPIHIRFGNDGHGKHLVVPNQAAASSLTSDGLSHLVAACSPAPFGRGKEDVLDETYRKAGKLDTHDFTTSFCPYSSGIVDVISQVLLPSRRFPRDKYDISAELYKLNVYSAPSGFFKPHVDTPRAKNQFGSLVVSLPVKHQGGALVVRHAGAQQIFDWSDCSDEHPSVQWSAFYSDCEHEVMEVTAGHRITLTYNLFMKRSAGHLAGLYTALEPTKLPLYNTLKVALQNPTFFSQGRVLGIWLSHSYAHTSKTQNFLPSSLKGADMVFYEAATAAGLTCHIRPLIHNGKWEYRDILGSRFGHFDKADYEEDSVRQQREFLKATVHHREGWKADLVTWLNPQDRSLMEPQAAQLTYGNQAELSLSYSSAVMLIVIPPFGKHSRMKPSAATTQKVFAGLCDDSDEYKTDYGYGYSEEESMSDSDHDPAVQAFMDGEIEETM